MIDKKLLGTALPLSSIEDKKTLLIAGYEEHGNQKFFFVQDDVNKAQYTLYHVDIVLPPKQESPLESRNTGWFTFHFEQEVEGEKRKLHRIARVATLEKLEV